MYILISLAVFVLVILGLRLALLYVRWPKTHTEEFKGTILQLGHNLACLPDRSHLDAELVKQKTIICFPGFLEDMRYFLALYHNTPARLIIINNANYHNPFSVTSSTCPDWFTPPPYTPGTIAHDAHCVNQVIEHMTYGENTVIHGHSRGGAVVLETGNQQPQRTKQLEAILEAAVVPKGKMAGNMEKKLQPVGFFLFPFLIALMRYIPKATMLKSPTMWTSSRIKEELFLYLPLAPKQYRTALTSGKDIIQWQAKTGYESYENFNKVTLFAGERDSVLWRKAMINSASNSAKVEIIETQGTDHFISLEKPDCIRDYFKTDKHSNASPATEKTTEAV
ncbi:hypothetical protein R50073_26460 [Maricurvus nonylphenolicus]|uniref:alpha/beta hydrolase n=1 Tax=Maricurvus nonylphenolicus TaxID=1008307 RepID=UPI0036F1F7A3